MTSTPTILAAGEIGPARYPIIARRNLKTVFVDTAKDAVTALESAHPALFITAAKLTDGPGILAISTALKAGVPALALCRADEWIVRAELVQAGAYDVLEHHRGDLVLREVAAKTGRTFARHDGGVADLQIKIRLPDGSQPRPAKVSIDTVVITTRSVLPIGVAGPISVLWDGPPLDFWTRVAASELAEGGARTTLRFTAVPESERLVLAGILEMALSRANAPERPERSLEVSSAPETLPTGEASELEAGDDSSDDFDEEDEGPSEGDAELFGDLELDGSGTPEEIAIANAQRRAGRRPKPKPLAGPAAQLGQSASATTLGRIQPKTTRAIPAPGGLVQQEVVREVARAAELLESRDEPHGGILRDFLESEE
ncbi:MAG: hypothetical protein HYV07_33800 [Deltaproteobacteria bacterium]|nr:hypothetical protein [Deltaproteobacteria bacterium]